MIVRQADPADLDVCCLLDPSYVTEQVWQMDTRSEDGVITVVFRTVRLPRPMKVSYPRDVTEVVERWRQGDPLFVAVDDHGEVHGYLSISIQRWHGMGWITNLVVDKLWRRQGVGTALLNVAQQWVRAQNLRGLISEVQTKNYPAISFLRKHGFTFCGYNERYYSNYDIALFFAKGL
jgi:ribosomal protein S18 acetylase RimI-like enzyme